VVRQSVSILFIFILQASSFAQLSVSAFITPRIEHEVTSVIQMDPRYETKVNTYATINGAYQKGQFFVEVGFGFLHKVDQILTREGVVYTGGGSGELNSYSFNHNNRFDYTNVQSKINFGGVIEKNRLSVAIGFGLQTEYLVGFNLNSFYGPVYHNLDEKTEPFKLASTSLYAKINPRWFFNSHVFIELNNLIGISPNQKSHLRKMNYNIDHSADMQTFFETGIGIGYKF
jgi:hypothetical protein